MRHRSVTSAGGYIELANVKNVLDVGAGTGHAMRFLKARFPERVIKCVEPVERPRSRGNAQGIPSEDLINGDGANLPFPDRSFDLVCEFAILHHVRRPDMVIAEMTRVAAKMLAISDCNFMGQGPGGCDRSSAGCGVPASGHSRIR